MSIATDRYVALLEFHAKLRNLGLTGNIELTVKPSEFNYWVSAADEASRFKYGVGLPRWTPGPVEKLTVAVPGGVAIIRKGHDE